MVTRRHFARILRGLGFVRLDNDRDPLIYQRAYGVFPEQRLVDVQLWRDGKHRVSHMVFTKPGYGRGSTPPTDFSDNIIDMYEAILNELGRTDHAN